ncbi:MAG: radical SAM protein [Planctomycetota bacterium]
MNESTPNAEESAPERHLTDHSRVWRENRYVYPVISRRARGLSIGVNLSPTKVCTFNCVYCQVDRSVEPVIDHVDLGTLIRELNAMCAWAASGEIWRDPHFADVPPTMRRVNDIAFSGDGEPTACRDFADMVQVAADAKARHGLKGAKLVVISNASRFHTQTFRKALPILQTSGGEVWAKLDAGSAERFVKVNRTSVPFKRILANIEWLARQMPVVIQSCFFLMDGEPPGETEIELYLARLRHLIASGGRIKGIQLYTIARPPAEPSVAPLPAGRLDALACRLRDALGDVPIETFGGAAAP